MENSGTDFTELDDPSFFEERRRVRERLERLPPHHADRASLVRLIEAMDDEFVKRAASAWQTALGEDDGAAARAGRRPHPLSPGTP